VDEEQAQERAGASARHRRQSAAAEIDLDRTEDAVLGVHPKTGYRPDESDLKAPRSTLCR